MTMVATPDYLGPSSDRTKVRSIGAPTGVYHPRITREVLRRFTYQRRQLSAVFDFPVTAASPAGRCVAVTSSGHTSSRLYSKRCEPWPYTRIQGLTLVFAAFALTSNPYNIFPGNLSRLSGALLFVVRIALAPARATTLTIQSLRSKSHYNSIKFPRPRPLNDYNAYPPAIHGWSVRFYENGGSDERSNILSLSLSARVGLIGIWRSAARSYLPLLYRQHLPSFTTVVGPE